MQKGAGLSHYDFSDDFAPTAGPRCQEKHVYLSLSSHVYKINHRASEHKHYRRNLQERMMNLFFGGSRTESSRLYILGRFRAERAEGLRRVRYAGWCLRPHLMFERVRGITC